MHIASMLFKKKNVVSRYITEVKSRHDIGIPTTFGYYNCGEKTGFNVRAMFSQYSFVLPGFKNVFHAFFSWTVCLCQN